MAAKTETIHCRAQPEIVDLIERASQVTAVDKTTFILNAVRREAEDVLLHHNIIKVSPEKFKAFEALLDGPVMQNDNLTKTLNSKAPWDK